MSACHAYRARPNDRRRLLCRHYGWGSPRDDDVDFEPGKLGRDFGQALAAPVCPAIFDRDRAALDPAEFPEALRECGRSLTFAQGCALTQKADGQQLPRLLRARRERPRRRAAEQRDELAPPDHSITSWPRSLVLCWSPKLRKPSNREHTTLGLLCEIVHTIGPNDQTSLPTSL